MEEFVLSDLLKSQYIYSTAILDDQGLLMVANPSDHNTKKRLTKFAEVYYTTKEFNQTSIITEKIILIVSKLFDDSTMIVECATDSNLGLVRHEINVAVSRLNSYLQSKSSN